MASRHHSTGSRAHETGPVPDRLPALASAAGLVSAPAPRPALVSTLAIISTLAMVPTLASVWAGCSLVDRYDECKVPGRCLLENTAKLCSDGEDNDEDGLVDCFDPSCSAFCTEDRDDLCSDGKDNDGDDLADCNDPDCSTTAPCVERGDDRCSDGLDTDLDGKTDCADEDCCEAHVCHNAELCGQVLADDDFQGGLDESLWRIVTPSAGHSRTTRVEPWSRGSDRGLRIVTATDVYACGQEVGIAYPQALDLGQGRITVEAEVAMNCAQGTRQNQDPEGVQEPEDPFGAPAACNEPVAIALTPYLGGEDLYVHAWGDRTYGNCNDETGTDRTSNAMARAPLLMLLVSRLGYKTLVWRFRRDNIFREGLTDEERRRIEFGEPAPNGIGSPQLATVADGTVFWHVRLDVDNDEVVVFEKDRATGEWVELYRTENLLPGRRFYPVVLATAAQNGKGGSSDFPWWSYVWVKRVTIRQHLADRPYWRTVYESDFTGDPSWSSNDPQRCRWAPEEQALAVDYSAQAQNNCYQDLPEAWQGQALRMTYTFRITDITWSGAFLPGLLDPASAATLSNFQFGITWVDPRPNHEGCVHPEARVCGNVAADERIGWNATWISDAVCWQRVGDCEQCDQWLRAEVIYDPRHETADLRIHQASTGQLLTGFWMEDVRCFIEMARFGLTALGALHYGGAFGRASGLLSHVKVEYGPLESSQ